jgi:hypothetical protein
MIFDRTYKLHQVCLKNPAHPVYRCSFDFFATNPKAEPAGQIVRIRIEMQFDDVATA